VLRKNERDEKHVKHKVFAHFSEIERFAIERQLNGQKKQNLVDKQKIEPRNAPGQAVTRQTANKITKMNQT